MIKFHFISFNSCCIPFIRTFFKFQFFPQIFGRHLFAAPIHMCPHNRMNIVVLRAYESARNRKNEIGDLAKEVYIVCVCVYGNFSYPNVIIMMNAIHRNMNEDFCSRGKHNSHLKIVYRKRACFICLHVNRHTTRID